MNFRDKILNDFNDKIIYPHQSFPDNRIHPSFDPLEETIFENEKFKNQLIFDPLVEAFAMSKTSYSYCMRSNVSYLGIHTEMILIMNLLTIILIIVDMLSFKDSSAP